MPVNKIKKKCVDDKFYTNPVVANNCILTLSDLLSNVDFLVEPSSGGGAFSENKNLIKPIKSYDISPPPTSNAIKVDFLSLNREDMPEGSFGVIGNPPFGERNNLSKGFIKKCVEMGDDVKFIAFILPAVFCKHSLQKVFPDNWKLLIEEELPRDSFLLEGEPYHVPCVWQVWTKEGGVNLRKPIPKKESELFDISTKNKNHDFFIFGASPSKVISVEEVSSNNRGYYIKSFVDKEELTRVVSEIDWRTKGKSSVNGGVAWFTVGEIINHIEEKWNGKFN